MYYERAANGPGVTELPGKTAQKMGHPGGRLCSDIQGLEKYDELEGIGWEWQSLDGYMVKAPLGLESVGKNPTDRGKNGDKTQCTDG